MNDPLDPAKERYQATVDLDSMSRKGRRGKPTKKTARRQPGQLVA